MTKYRVLNQNLNVIRRVEAAGYRLIDGYFVFASDDKRKVLSIRADVVLLIEEDSE